MSDRIGVLGGAFDPIHLGHLILASEAKSQLNLDLMLFVPTFESAHQQKTIATSFTHRCAMVTAAITGIDAFRLCESENRFVGRSYTVQTIDALRQEYPVSQLVFVMGADSLEQFDTWREPERLLSMITVGVAGRPGHAIVQSSSSQQIVSIDMLQIDISSSDIRRRVRAGLPIRFLVPSAVEAYIQKEGLYQE